jgi:hypothetical protein
MIIRIVREPSRDDGTFGVVFVNGHFFGFSLEDPVREVDGVDVAAWKVKGVTAIPAGTYGARLALSPRARRDVPWLDAVPGFSAIQIHPLNRTEETEGCIGIGFARRSGPPPVLLQSRAACDELTRRMRSAGGKALCVVENPIRLIA